MTTNELTREQADLAALDRDAVIYWLRNAADTTTREARRTFAFVLMKASVLTQAYMEGLVDCARCGMAGCGWCSLTIASGVSRGPDPVAAYRWAGCEA